MATTTKAPYVAIEQQEEYDAADSLTTTDDQLLSDDLSEATCPTCGELLAWHEQACSSGPVPQPEKEHPVTQIWQVGPHLAFAYELGHQVKPAASTPARTVIWRGQVRERHPQTGLVHRVNVYRLDNGFWDCYYETELQVA